MLGLLPKALSARPTGGRGPTVGIRTWRTRKRKNLGLNWVGDAHPRADQEINPGSQISLNSKRHGIPTDVSHSQTKCKHWRRLAGTQGGKAG